jgi:hypothetical protein
MESLRHLGLVFNPDPYGYRGHMAILPDSVAQRLLPSERLATVLEGEWPRVAERQRGLALVSLLIIIAQEAQAGSIGPQEAYPEPTHGYIPAGFIVHPSDSENLTRLVKTYNPGDRIRLIPPPAIPNADVTRLAAQTGQPEEVVDFAAKLLMTLGILNMQSGVSVEPTLLRRVLEMDAVAQLELLAGGWLRMAGWVESELLFGDGGPIRFAWNPRHVAPHFSLAMAEAVEMVVRLVGRMPFDDWYDAASFVETVEALVPFATPTLTTTRQASQQLDLTWHGEPQPGRKLDLRSNEGWSLFVRALVDAVLSGPLNWLGLVDVQQQRGRVTGFRVRPTAPVIDGKPIDPALLVAEGTISVGDDLTIVVPAGSASLGPLAPILQLSDLSRVDAEGLHYQLTPNGLQALFEYGHDPASVAGLLADALGKPIPKAARAMIDDWWERYGQVRIYDELTLIELGDDLLLRELQAATSLGRAVVHQFTPRLIAIEDGAVEQIVAELGARGYAPRIVAGD